MAIGNERTRSFDDSTTEESHDSGLRFELAGEWFETLPEVPATAMNNIARAVTVDGRGNQVFNSVDIIAFFDQVLIDRRWVTDAEDGSDAHWAPADDVSRFRALCDSKTRVIRIEKLGEVFLWIVQELTDRPTTPPAR